MAGISTVGGIVIPISIVKTGDKNVVKKVANDIRRLRMEISKANKSISAQKTGVEAYNKQLNVLRWTMVNVTFIMTAMAGIAMPWILATKSAAEYQDQLVKIQSVTGAMPDISSSIVMGAKAGRPFSKTDVAAGFLEFSKAGFTATETASALNSILDLSVVGFMDVNDAAQLTVQMIRAFNLQAEDASHIMDVLSNVADNSKIDVGGLGTALGYVATVAEGANQTLETTTMILGVLADAGLNNSKAGTSLRQTLAALIDPSEKAQKAMRTLGISFVDSSGNIKQMNVFLEELKRSLEGLDPGRQQELLGGMFEIRALAGVSAAINRLDSLGGSFDGLLETTNLQNTAMVKAMQQQESAINQMKTATEAFKDAFQGAGDTMLERTREMTQATTKLGRFFGDLTQTFAKGFNYMTSSWEKFRNAMTIGIVAGLGAFLLGIGGWFAAAIIAVGALFGGAGLSDLEAKIKSLFGGDDVTDEITNWAKIAEAIKGASEETLRYVAAFRSIPALDDILVAEFGGSGQAIADHLKNIEKLNDQITRYGDGINAMTVVSNDPESSKDEVKFAAESVKYYKEEWEKASKAINAAQKSIREIQQTTVGMEDFVDGLKEAQKAAVSLDSAVVLLKKDLEDDIFGKLLGTKKFTKTSDTLEDFVANIKSGVADIRTFYDAQRKTKVVGDDEIQSFESATIAIDGYLDKIKESETELRRLSIVREDQEALVTSAREKYNKEKKELQELNKEYSELTKTISKLSGARFKNETKTLNIIGKVNNLIKQQELATLGVADANTFISDALKLETSDYDTLIAQITKINSEMTSNTGAFEAWQESIKQAIMAEVEAGQSLGKDVTDRVKTWQTALMGISETSFGDGGAKSQAEEFANKLQLAYDVHFGGMKDEVGNFLSEQKDREVGVFDTSSKLIEALEREIILRDAKSREIVDAESDVAEALLDLDEKAGNLADTMRDIADMEKEIRDQVMSIMDLVEEESVDFAEGMVGAMKKVDDAIDNFLNKQIYKVEPLPTSDISTLIGDRSLTPPTTPRISPVSDIVPFAPLLNAVANKVNDDIVEPVRNYFEIAQMSINANSPQSFMDEVNQSVDTSIDKGFKLGGNR